MHQYIVVSNERREHLNFKFPMAGYVEAEKVDLGRAVLKGDFAKSYKHCFLRSYNYPILNQTIEIKRQGDSASIDLPTIEVPARDISFEVVLETDAQTVTPLFSCALALTYRPENVVFVVGSPRSGTTAVGNAVQKAFDTVIHGESHLAEIIISLVERAQKALLGSPARNIDGMLVNEITPADMQMNVIQLLKRLHRQFYGDSLVLDKTPGGPNIQALWLMLRAYPNAKVIFCKRRGIENVISRLKKFPQVSFSDHCTQWRQTFSIWGQTVRLNTRELCAKDWHFEIDQFRLACEPDAITKELSDWLGLSEVQQQRALEYLKYQSPQKTSDYKKALDFDELEWSQEQKQVFIDTCGEQMEKQGYSLGSDYFA